MNHNILIDLGMATIAAALFAIPAFKLRLPLILAYIFAGVVIGSNIGVGWISDSENIGVLSEIGLVLLLFILGVEINLQKLFQAGKAVVINGFTQFITCFALAYGFFYLFGYRNLQSQHTLTYIAVAVSLSSTLIVVKILTDRFEIDTLPSRITLGILVFQDLWAIGFIALQPNLGLFDFNIILISLLKVCALIAFAALSARYILPYVFNQASKHPEILLMTALGWCFGVCGLANVMNLSLEMGALVAGVSIASYPYHNEVASRISSLRDYFISLFFVVLGIRIPFPSVSVLGLAVLIIVFVLLSRITTIFPVLYRLNYGVRASLIPAINLSQLSEFALVLGGLGVSYGHIQTDILSSFVIAMIATAILSTAIIPNAHYIHRFFIPVFRFLKFEDLDFRKDNDEKASENFDLTLLGFYKDGSSLLAEILSRFEQESFLKIQVIDLNPEAHFQLKKMGIRSNYGDITQIETLRNFKVHQSHMVVCSLSDSILKGSSNLKLLKQLKILCPNSRLIMTAENSRQAIELYENGADYVYIPRLIGAQYMADVVESMYANKDIDLKRYSVNFLKNWNEIIA